MNLKKTGKLFTSKFVWAGPSYYVKRIYRAAVSQRLWKTDQGNTELMFDINNRWRVYSRGNAAMQFICCPLGAAADNLRQTDSISSLFWYVLTRCEAYLQADSVILNTFL
jgi:hypothetical protein